MKPIKTILHPTDFSDSYHYALEVAAVIARDQKARLIVLHVVPMVLPVTGAGDVSALERAERYQQDLKSYQAEMKERLQQLKIPDCQVSVARHWKEGEVAPVILRTAQETPCDLIVLGTHGQTGRMQRLMGSVAEEVSRSATCPVLTVRLPQ